LSKRKLILVAVAVAAIVLVVALFFLVRNLDGLVERAIEKYGSAAAGTAVRVDGVKIGLQAGRGAIHGLTVANPPGFAREPLFALGEIALDLDTASLTAKVPVIEEIKIAAPQFLYQLNAKGESNLGVIQRHLKSAGGKTEKSSDEPPPRLKIKRLTIAGGKGTVDLSAFGGKRLQATLPPIVLTNLGGSKGITAEELSRTVLNALVRALEEAAARQGVEQLLRKEAGGTLQRLLGQ